MRSPDTQLDLLHNDQRYRAINEIVTYFKTERDEEIGIIAAEAVLDFILDVVGNSIYNKGVRDTKTLIAERLEDFSVDIEALMRNEPNSHELN